MKKLILYLLLYSFSSCIQQKHSQEPQSPFPYTSEEVRFENQIDGASFAGTLTIPNDEKIMASVILDSGSGLQDRDESVYVHKPFLVLSDYLTRQGIAVLRYDERSIGESRGKIIGSTTETFAGDTFAGIEFLQSREDLPNNIGIIGHSEGGLITMLLASHYKEIAFIILLGTPGLPFDEVLFNSNEKKLRTQGKNHEIVEAGTYLLESLFEEIKKDETHKKKKKKLSSIINRWRSSLRGEAKEDIDKFIEENPNWLKYVSDEWATPWFQYAANFNPRQYLEKVQCPVLALIGDKDCQVLADGNLEAINEALVEGKNKNFKVESLKGLNHLFQKCDTGFRDEYKLINETFNEDAMKMIVKWIIAL